MFLSDSNCSTSGDVINSVVTMISLLKNEAACYGPSTKELIESEQMVKSLKEEVKNAEAMFTMTSTIRRNFEDGQYSNDKTDSPELLQISNGMLENRVTVISKDISRIKAFSIAKGKKNDILKLSEQVSNILKKSSNELMELRQFFLNARGDAPSFRASKSNMEEIIKAATNTQVKDNSGFVEV